MRWLTRLTVLALALAALAFVPVSAKQATRPTIALLDFDYGSIERWWGGNVDVGKGVADLMVEQLVNDGSFRVIDRKRIQTVLAEQDFNASDRVDPTAKAAQIGKVLGVKFLIAGTITKFGTEQSNKSVGAGGFGSKYGIGKVGTASGKANVGITLNVIDASTAEILVVAKGEGTSKRSGLLLSGGAGGVGKSGVGELDFSASNFHDTIIGEATEVAVKDATTKLLAKKDRIK
jgi:curli biogenesis system outer membrane secretion channel CsgG